MGVSSMGFHVRATVLAVLCFLSAPALAQPQGQPSEADSLYEACAGGQAYDPKTAIDACTRALQSGLFMGEENGELYLLRSSHFLQLGDFDAQLRDADLAQRLLPNDPEPYFAREIGRAHV